MRRKRLLDALTDGGSPRQLLIAWLSRVQGHGLKEFGNQLADAESTWVKSLKARKLDDQPAAVQAELPDGWIVWWRNAVRPKPSPWAVQCRMPRRWICA